tara:strand:- start:554 stop:1330 length:777 start_codon:yes stop_codon:yes gene_type:complete
MNNTNKNFKIKIENLKKNYGEIRALKGVSLEVHIGEVLVIIGPSGCGKSTFLRCMNLLEEPTEGILQIGNKIINFADKKTIPIGRNVARFRSQFGMVFQQFDLFSHKTAIENIMIGLTVVKKIPYDEAKNISLKLLKQVGLEDVEHRLPKELSGGQQQRVAIARALAMSPEVLLFDEVTSALDPELVGEVLEVMRNLAKEGATMIVVTHEMAFAQEVADRIVFIDEGLIIEEASAKEIIENPQNDRTKLFLSRFRNNK